MVRLRPLLKVDVPEVVLSAVVCRPPPNVVVPVPSTARLVVVALVRSVVPVSVVEAKTAERLAKSWPLRLSVDAMVDEPVTLSAVVVAPTKVAPPLKAIWVVVAFERNGYAKVS